MVSETYKDIKKTNKWRTVRTIARHMKDGRCTNHIDYRYAYGLKKNYTVGDLITRF